MFQKVEDLTTDELLDLFEDHDCLQEECTLCIEYMTRFNPKRLIDLGIDEDPEVQEELLQV